MKVSIIIPTYNERQNILALIPMISSELKTHNINGTVIVVDDNSPDKTGEAVKALSKESRVIVVERKHKLGIGSAYKAGIRKAAEIKSDIVITMDADLSHDPKKINELISKIKEGHDVVIGSRYIEGGEIKNWSIFRKLISKVANKLSKGILKFEVNDLTSGYRAYKRKVLDNIQLKGLKSNGYSFLLEILHRCIKRGYEVGEIPITFEDRGHGTSKLSKIEILKYVVTIIRLKLFSRTMHPPSLMVGHDYEERAFSSGLFPQRNLHQTRLKELSEYFIEGNYFLDIGCGSGHVISLSRCKISIGIDLDEKTLWANRNKKRIKNKKVYFVVGDARKLPFKETVFDFITCTHVIEHFEDVDCVFEDIRRVLNIDGNAIITTPNHRSLWPIVEIVWSMLPSSRNYMEEHINHFNPNGLKGLMIESGFKVNNVKTSQAFIMPNETIKKVLLPLDRLLSSRRYGMMLLLHVSRDDSQF